VMAYRALSQPMIGWIGAGRMGLQMAFRLLDAGYDVAVYNRTAAKAAPMVSRGAVTVDSPADLAGRDVETNSGDCLVGLCIRRAEPNTQASNLEQLFHRTPQAGCERKGVCPFGRTFSIA